MERIYFDMKDMGVNKLLSHTDHSAERLGEPSLRDRLIHHVGFLCVENSHSSDTDMLRSYKTC